MKKIILFLVVCFACGATIVKAQSKTTAADSLMNFSKSFFERSGIDPLKEAKGLQVYSAKTLEYSEWEYQFSTTESGALVAKKNVYKIPARTPGIIDLSLSSDSIIVVNYSFGGEEHLVPYEYNQGDCPIKFKKTTPPGEPKEVKYFEVKGQKYEIIIDPKVVTYNPPLLKFVFKIVNSTKEVADGYTVAQANGKVSSSETMVAENKKTSTSATSKLPANLWRK